MAASAGAGSLMDVFQAIQAQMQGVAASDEPPLAHVEVSRMAFHPAGTCDFCAVPTGTEQRHCTPHMCCSSTLPLQGCLEAIAEHRQQLSTA